MKFRQSRRWDPQQESDQAVTPQSSSLIKSLSRRSFGQRMGLFLVGVGMSSAIAACTGSGTSGGSSEPAANQASAPQKPVEITLVSYAVTQAAYEQIIPKFVEKWK
ncbi:MAG TPA: sulfate ABC transporter substrate-binding protein, partial [Leptolyngbyaceae cyanobacterium]